jgi:hypothetical protein
MSEWLSEAKALGNAIYAGAFIGIGAAELTDYLLDR